MTEHVPLQAFASWSGPRNARIVLVGEAWGEGESQLRKPFVGESGKELWRMLGEAMPEVAPELHAEASAMHRYGFAWVAKREAWLEAAGIAMTNVLALRPPGNKLEELCGKKADVGGKTYTLPPVSKGKYLRPEFLPELQRLYHELAECKPNLVIVLGNTACWALLQVTNIGSIRGSVAMARPPASAVKVLPTYHPAGVLRQWSWRPIVVADLMKGLRESAFPEIRRPARRVLINPTLAEITAWAEKLEAAPPEWLAADIETGAGQIKCISFAPSPAEALVVPFVDLANGGSYWPTVEQELEAWRLVFRLLAVKCPKLFQNGVYDLQYITRMGCYPTSCTEDTMLLHHSLFPELQKGLGFLGSIYTGEASWKLMRKEVPDSEKRDE